MYTQFFSPCTYAITEKPRDKKKADTVDDTNDDQGVTGEDKENSSKDMKQSFNMIFSNSEITQELDKRNLWLTLREN